MQLTDSASEPGSTSRHCLRHPRNSEEARRNIVEATGALMSINNGAQMECSLGMRHKNEKVFS
jgi:hypothetical protein